MVQFALTAMPVGPPRFTKRTVTEDRHGSPRKTSIAIAPEPDTDFPPSVASSPLHLPLPRSRLARFSPKGSLLAVTLGGPLVLIDARNRRKIAEVLPDWSAMNLAFSPDGTVLAVQDWAENLAFVSLAGDNADVTGQWEEVDFDLFEFSPCGKSLVATSPDKGLLVIDTATEDVVFELPSPDAFIEDLDCSAQRDRWVTAHVHRPHQEGLSSLAEFRVWSWPLDTASCQTLPYRVREFCRMALHPNGDLLAVSFGEPEKTLQIYSISRRMILHSQPAVTEPAYILSWSPCGRYLAFSSALGTAVSVLDFQTRDSVHEFVVGKFDGTSVSDWPSDARFSPDGSLLAISGKWGRVVKLSDAKGSKAARTGPKNRPRRPSA